MAGLILDWRRQGMRWSAWVVWIDDQHGRTECIEQGWIKAEHLGPARSDPNIWNDGPWR